MLWSAILTCTCLMLHRRQPTRNKYLMHYSFMRALWLRIELNTLLTTVINASQQKKEDLNLYASYNFKIQSFWVNWLNGGSIYDILSFFYGEALKISIKNRVYRVYDNISYVHVSLCMLSACFWFTVTLLQPFYYTATGANVVTRILEQHLNMTWEKAFLNAFVSVCV